MPESVTINRELSWLQFNLRVLEESLDPRNPIFERLKFLSIYMSNLDEFYRVRVGTLFDQIDGREQADDAQATPKLFNDILKTTRRIIPAFCESCEEIFSALGAAGIQKVGPGDELTDSDRTFLKQKFEREIAPLIAPYIIEKQQLFPFFENGQIIIGVTMETKRGRVAFGLIPITPALPRVVALPGGGLRFMLVEDLIYMHVKKIFHKFAVQERIIFSIIRNADIDEDEGLYDYDIDFKETVNKLIKRRNILSPVKLKYFGGAKRILAHLGKVLYLKNKQIFEYNTPLDFKFIAEIESRLTPDMESALCYPRLSQAQVIGKRESAMARARHGDFLISTPYQDMLAIVKLIDEAANDDDVSLIRMTLYRVASGSKVVGALINAAKSGKKVVCVLELRARFDEENNIDWAKRLSEAGCQVLYGLPRYKVHAKLLLIESGEDPNRRIAVIGTGNFNEITGRIYTDLFLVTAHSGICADVKAVFEALENKLFVESADHLLLSPIFLKNRLMGLIDAEIAKKAEGRPAAITLKLNSLTDMDLINKLCEASSAGVPVRMIVRGICCLIPGVPGLTDNIEVRSVVGRFLEHSRIYAFGTGRGRRFYISSADFMVRNTTQRVEAAVPVYDRKCKRELAEMLNLYLSDNVNARILDKNCRYTRKKARAGARAVDSQEDMIIK